MMSWLDRLKNENVPGTHATKTTKTPQEGEKVVFVGFVAYPPAHIQKSQAMDEGAASTDSITQDAYCWPNSSAANEQELDLMARRLEQFKRLGLDVDTSERMADRLLQRDRDPSDDRAMCLECASLSGGRCINSRAAGLRQPELGSDYALELKRCNGFAPGQGTLVFGSVQPPKPLQRPQHGHPLTTAQKVAAQQYHQHHAQCSRCQSAGRGYTSRCSAGAALWNQYQTDTKESTQ